MRRLFGRYVARGTRRAAGYARRIADHTIVIADDSYRMSLTHVLAYPFIYHLFSFSSLLLFFPSSRRIALAAAAVRVNGTRRESGKTIFIHRAPIPNGILRVPGGGGQERKIKISAALSTRDESVIRDIQTVERPLQGGGKRPLFSMIPLLMGLFIDRRRASSTSARS